MHARPAVDFLRRRYATAILHDDAQTADRLRDQLDRLMNQAGRPRDADLRERVATPVASTEPADLFGLLASVSGHMP